ncbi:MAG TPA: hypothetical protein VFU21_07270 [Kofleriaceae bacterium]|nr:hypothetical protein [Kofleriaceae bacterium]
MRSWLWMFLGTWLVTSGGCTCIIDADRYRGGGPHGDGGGMDGPDNAPDGAGADGRVESDAGPIEPTSFREGEGSGTGAPPVVIVLRGGPFAAGATVRVVRNDDTETDLVVEPPEVSGDGSMLAVAIRIPVDVELDETENATLEVFVDDESEGTLLVDGLDEADLSGTIDTDTDLRPLYSRITFSNPVEFAGASPAILRSTTDITSGFSLDAAGRQSGNGIAAGAPGPAGCAGGAVHAAGDCSIGGGEPGGTQVSTGTGGGGGGHATEGTGGANGGNGGQRTGNERLLPLSEEGGNGGGGGGDGMTGDQGAGGGGGGVVELTAAGRIRLDGEVSANGGRGSNGNGALAATAEGSGGGGSGGAILVRAIAIVGAGSLTAVGAEGGTTFNVGGRGADGRIRVDVGSEGLPTLDSDPAPFRGPHWANDTEHLVRQAEFTATLYGQPNTTFAASVDGSDPEDVETDIDGRGTFMVTLEPGHNRICAIVSPDAQLLPEAVRCTIVTYVPE